MRKLLTLALIGGGAAYLFKTKKGAELRNQITDAAMKLKDRATDYYQQQKTTAEATSE